MLAASLILQNVWGLVAIFKYDVFIFGFGRSLLLYNLDLIILKFLHKTSICHLGHGSDSRPPYLDGFYQTDESRKLSPQQTFKLTRKTFKRVKFHQKYSAILIGSPLSTSQFASSQFINSLAIGLPLQIQKVEKKNKPRISFHNKTKPNTVKILHAPSNPAAKGSALIVRAIKNLKTKGYLIDFKLLTKKEYSEVIEELQFCDFVIDQLYSDAPMAAFAAEAASFGKPAIVGGYELEKLAGCISSDALPPSKLIHPSEIESSIEELINDTQQREHLGKCAQTFIEDNWTPVKVAERYFKLIDMKFPQSWWVEPLNCTFFKGAGQSEAETRRVVDTLVKNYGVASLNLEHNVRLRNDLLSFCDKSQ